MACKTCGNSNRYKNREEPSLSDLLEAKKFKDDNERQEFKSSLGNMSEDLKTFHVINLIKVINGEEFSPLGQSPQYCVSLLYKILTFEEFNYIHSIYPELKDIIDKKYKELMINKIECGSLFPK